ncbi:hypothetical protein BH24ACT5_BH24ACT5_24050 [soil metagenome]
MEHARPSRLAILTAVVSLTITGTALGSSLLASAAPTGRDSTEAPTKTTPPTPGAPTVAPTAPPATIASATIAPVTITPATITPATLVPATVAPTAPPVTVAGPTLPIDGPTLEGEWTMARRVTVDEGFWSGNDLVVESRTVQLTCADPTCASIDLFTRLPGTTDQRSSPTPLAITGAEMQGSDNYQLPCQSKLTDDFDGPDTADTTVSYRLQLAPTNPVTITGTFQQTLVTPESAECYPEQISYQSTVQLVPMSAPAIPAVVADYTGDSTDRGRAESGVHACTEPTCAITVRELDRVPNAAGDLDTIFIDYPMTAMPDGTYGGAAAFGHPCLNEADDSVVNPAGYQVQSTLTASFVTTASNEPMIRTTRVDTMTPSPLLGPTEVALCPATTVTAGFIGLPGGPEFDSRMDWLAPAAA